MTSGGIEGGIQTSVGAEDEGVARVHHNQGNKARRLSHRQGKEVKGRVHPQDPLTKGLARRASAIISARRAIATTNARIRRRKGLPPRVFYAHRYRDDLPRDASGIF